MAGGKHGRVCPRRPRVGRPATLRPWPARWARPLPTFGPLEWLPKSRRFGLATLIAPAVWTHIHRSWGSGQASFGLFPSAPPRAWRLFLHWLPVRESPIAHAPSRAGPLLWALWLRFCADSRSRSPGASRRDSVGPPAASSSGGTSAAPVSPTLGPLRSPASTQL